MTNERICIFTDGGCSGNPGPGGWAYVILNRDGTILDETWGAEANTTNNRMELSAAVAALERIQQKIPGSGTALALYTDSQYVQKGISTWIHSWKRNGWRTSSKEPVKNKDLWQKLDELAAQFSIEWHWVKGHAGHTYNERVDRMTQEAIASIRS